MRPRTPPHSKDTTHTQMHTKVRGTALALYNNAELGCFAGQGVVHGPAGIFAFSTASSEERNRPGGVGITVWILLLLLLPVNVPN